MAEKVLLVGNGGREHALAQGLMEPGNVSELHVTRPNAGIAMMPGVVSVDIGPQDPGAIANYAQEEGVGLVVVGPGAPLIAGLGDRLRIRNIAVFGPNAEAALLESSKIWAADFMKRHAIPRPSSWPAHCLDDVRRIALGRPARSLVVKADGEAAGKGVVLPDTKQGLYAVAAAMLSGASYGGAGRNGILIQERLSGPEVSVFAISDGRDCRILPYFARDYKRLRDDNQGPNTGSMGAYTLDPDTALTPRQRQKIEEIAQKTIQGMAAEGVLYQGVLYLGLMLANEPGENREPGDPAVIEYNCRFGDPETEVIMPLLIDTGVDTHAMLHESAHGRLPDLSTLHAGGRAGGSNRVSRLRRLSRSTDYRPQDQRPRQALRGRNRLPCRHKARE